MTAPIRHALLLTLLAMPAFALAQETSATDQTVAQDAVQEAPAAPAEAALAPQDEPMQASEAAPEDPVAEPATNDTTAAATAGTIGSPPAGKGRIVFFRPSKFAGAAIGFKVREGDVELGKLRSGKYFVADVDPGTHEYTVHSETKDVLTMEVEVGETYYVQGTITMGFMAGRPNLSPSDEATFNGMADKLKLAN